MPNLLSFSKPILYIYYILLTHLPHQSHGFSITYLLMNKSI